MQPLAYTPDIAAKTASLYAKVAHIIPEIEWPSFAPQIAAINALKMAEVVMLTVDATEGLNDQDLRIAQLIEREGRACILVLNKWDAVVDRDGTPMVMDGANGALLDGGNPARAGALIQVLVSGLGRVAPSWPVGMAGPMGEAAPAVTAPVKAYLDGSAIEVVKATLAPGYIGYYLVEVRLPDVVNSGGAELFLEAGNSLTNKVRLYIEP